MAFVKFCWITAFICLLDPTSGCRFVQDYIPKMSNPLLDSVKKEDPPKLKIDPPPEVELRTSSSQNRRFADFVEEEASCGFYPKSASCDQFFHGTTWPQMKEQVDSSELVKLCQNNLDKQVCIDSYLLVLGVLWCKKIMINNADKRKKKCTLVSKQLLSTENQQLCI